jgi:hypothetical protein
MAASIPVADPFVARVTAVAGGLPGGVVPPLRSMAGGRPQLRGSSALWLSSVAQHKTL